MRKDWWLIFCTLFYTLKHCVGHRWPSDITSFLRHETVGKRLFLRRPLHILWPQRPVRLNFASAGRWEQRRVSRLMCQKDRTGNNDNDDNDDRMRVISSSSLSTIWSIRGTTKGRKGWKHEGEAKTLTWTQLKTLQLWWWYCSKYMQNMWSWILLIR